MKKVMVFGVFDGLHDGHRAFLKEAKNYGDYLIVAMAQDHIVEHLKGHLPKIDFSKRFEELKKEDGVDEVVIGDSELSTYEVVKKYHPDVIALGYDQSILKEDIEKNIGKLGYQPEIKTMKAFESVIHQ
jgi:FAD synthetase